MGCESVNASDLARLLAEAIDGFGIEGSRGRAESYEDAGLLTRDAGIVLRFEDGSEFQITVKQSRAGHGLKSFGDSDPAAEGEAAVRTEAERDALAQTTADEAFSATDKADASGLLTDHLAAAAAHEKAAKANRAAGFDNDAREDHEPLAKEHHAAAARLAASNPS